MVVNGMSSVMFIFHFNFFVSRTDGELHVSDLFNLNTLYNHNVKFMSVQSLGCCTNFKIFVMISSRSLGSPGLFTIIVSISC